MDLSQILNGAPSAHEPSSVETIKLASGSCSPYQPQLVGESPHPRSFPSRPEDFGGKSVQSNAFSGHGNEHYPLQEHHIPGPQLNKAQGHFVRPISPALDESSRMLGLSQFDTQNLSDLCHEKKMTLFKTLQLSHIAKGSKYGCALCSRNFRRKNDLSRHLYVHLGIRPHVCKVCSRAFSQKGSLKMHERLHQ